MFWLVFAIALLTLILFPDSWLIDGISESHLLGLILVPILSLPLAYFIENLRPKRTVVYCLSALAPATVFFGNVLLQQVLSQQESSSREYLYFLLGAAPIFLGLPIAIFLLRHLRRKNAPYSSPD
jgi:4-amino-4-deoxy-L-arabinose transferase-like glycosyltransferase